MLRCPSCLHEHRKYQINNGALLTQDMIVKLNVPLWLTTAPGISSLCTHSISTDFKSEIKNQKIKVSPMIAKHASLLSTRLV
jgi:hypothetical protein